jgi:membrane associated rhomboid family serine protease
MLPAAYIPFFAASIGASGALIGLLFIAISIAPERTVGTMATPERAAVAGAAFTARSNVFFIALVILA